MGEGNRKEEVLGERQTDGQTQEAAGNTVRWHCFVEVLISDTVYQKLT
jgi:hypothetical protein